MNLWSQYIVARTVDEALSALSTAPRPVCPIAGGTDLLLELQQNRHPPVHTLVDITHIPALNCLELRHDRLFIGAAVPVRVITESLLVRAHAMAVSEACGLIGGPQVRNTATLGGNVAHALPAADGMIALCAVDAVAEIAAPEGRRLEPILNLFRGPGVSALDKEREFLVGFYIPVQREGQSCAFGRVMRPQGVALPILNMAAWLQRSEDRIEAIRIAVGPAGPVPRRAVELEQALLGRAFDPDAFALARGLVRTSLHYRSNPLRGSAAYRYDLTEVLLEDVIGTAWQRAALPAEQGLPA